MTDTYEGGYLKALADLQSALSLFEISFEALYYFRSIKKYKNFLQSLLKTLESNREFLEEFMKYGGFTWDKFKYGFGNRDGKFLLREKEGDKIAR